MTTSLLNPSNKLVPSPETSSGAEADPPEGKAHLPASNSLNARSQARDSAPIVTFSSCNLSSRAAITSRLRTNCHTSTTTSQMP